MNYDIEIMARSCYSYDLTLECVAYRDYTTVELLWWWNGVVIGADGCFEVSNNAV